MRLKDDHMMNGQLKLAYHTQISTENQFILNYTIHQQTNDTTTLKRHLENFEKLYGKKRMDKLEELTTDAGYGSQKLRSTSRIP